MSNHLVRFFDPIQFELIKGKLQNEAYIIMDGCFEKEFVYKKEFQVLILFVILYRNGILNQKIIEDIFDTSNVIEDHLLDTIQVLFQIHDCVIPQDITEVIEQLSNYLPPESSEIQEIIKQNCMKITKVQLNENMRNVRDLMRKGEYSNALELILIQLPHGTSNPYYWYTAGLLYFKLDQWNQAEECFLSTLQLDPFYSDAWNILGLIYYYEKWLNQAKLCFRTALMVNYYNINAWKNLLFIAHKQKNEKLVQLCLKELKSLSKTRKCKK